MSGDEPGAVCESCGSTNTRQTGTGSAPFPNETTPSIVVDYECLDCGDRWNVWL